MENQAGVSDLTDAPSSTIDQEGARIVASFPPKPVDIETLVKEIVKSRVLNGSTQSLAKKLREVEQKSWLAPNDKRYVLAIALASDLQKYLVDQSYVDSMPDFPNELSSLRLQKLRETMTKLVDQTSARRAATVATLLLAPEDKFRAVVSRFSDDAQMLSAVFSMPLSAARLRLAFDKDNLPS